MTFKRNLNPLEGFLVILVFIVAAFVIISCCGCKTTKSTTKTTTYAVSDSSNCDSSALQKVSAEDIERFTHIEVTTTEGVPSSTVTLVEAADSPNDTTVKSGSVTLSVHTNKKGQRIIECKSDSLQRVVTRLYTDSVMRSHRFDSLLLIKSLTDKHSDSATLNEVVSKEQSGWWCSLRSILIILIPVFLFGFFVGFIAKSHLKKVGL